MTAVRNGFKKRICLILAAMMIAMTVMPAMAEELQEEVPPEFLEDAVIGLEYNNENTMTSVIVEAAEKFVAADSISVCGCNVEDGECLYATLSEESQQPVGPGGSTSEEVYCLETSKGIPEDIGDNYAYYHEGKLELVNFNLFRLIKVNDEDENDTLEQDEDEDDPVEYDDDYELGIASDGDLVIKVYGDNGILAENEKGISCKKLIITSMSSEAFLGLKMEDPKQKLCGIECDDFYIDNQCEVFVDNRTDGKGIVCDDFIMEKCENTYLTIVSTGDGLCCNKFTLVSDGKAMVKVYAGYDAEYVGIRANGEVLIDCPKEKNDDNIEIFAGDIGISSKENIVVKSGHLMIGNGHMRVGVGIQTKKTLVIGTNEEERKEDSDLLLTVNSEDIGFEAEEIDLEYGDIDINVFEGRFATNAVEKGIVADKILINDGEVAIHSSEKAMVISDDNQITIADKLGIITGTDGNYEYVNEYIEGTDLAIEEKTCDHNNAIVIEGKKPTSYEDGWKDYYKCSDCGRLYEGKECTVRIAHIEAWKTGRGRLPKPEPDSKPDLKPDPKLVPNPDPDPIPVPKPAVGGYTAPAAKPVTTGSMENPVTGGIWKKLENGKWIFATNASFKDTWGCIEYTKSNGEKTKGWFRFDKEGNMLVGYHEVNGKKYYFCEQEGDMYGMCQLGGIAPNGQKINEDGSLVE